MASRAAVRLSTEIGQGIRRGLTHTLADPRGGHIAGVMLRGEWLDKPAIGHMLEEIRVGPASRYVHRRFGTVEVFPKAR